VKIAAGRVDKFLRSPDAGVVFVLVYGPDSGLVNERAIALVRAVAGSESDPFRVSDLPAVALKSDPARLADEASAQSMTGGRRAVRLSGAADAITPIVAAYLEGAKADSLIVAEAGILGPRSSLRRLAEKLTNGAAIACYADDGRSLGQVIAESLKDRGLSATADARAYLATHLGSDRRVTRAELEKLALYVGDAKSITLEDAQACVGDNAATSLDAIAYAAGSADQEALDRALRRAFLEGVHPVPILRAVIRHFQRLHYASGMVRDGKSPKQALDSLKPPVIFRFADIFQAQIRLWPYTRLATALEILTEAEIACKSSGPAPEALTGRALMRIAQAAGRGRSAA
jgi:DNA polymerase-3 subunit delta